MSDAMEILRAAGITNGKAYDALTYTKWKDGIDVDVPTVELNRIILLATNAKIEQLEAENAELKESIYYCSGSCKALTQSIGVDDGQ